LNDIEQSIKNKVESIGRPIKEWDVQIYRGVLTGYNDAFIISSEKRNEILSKCVDEAEKQRTAAIIRPILRGRDIQRYSYDFANQYLISTFPSREYDIEDYPAIKAYLLAIGIRRLEQTGKEYIIDGEKVKARKKTHNKWFETQDSISYWDDLSKPKIVWGEISDKSKFCIDENGEYYPEATTFMLTGDNLYYLLAFLNCSVSEYVFSTIGTTTGVGTVRWKKYKILELSVPNHLPQKEIERISELCRKVVSLKQAYSPEYYDAECALNYAIYSIYGLNDAEIQFVENHIR